VAALVSGIAVWSFLRPRGEPERAVSRFTVNLPPEQALAWANDPSVALSPDGRRLVYVGGLGEERKLYVRSLDQLEASPMPGTEGAATAFFSPDGEWVGFYVAGKLRKVGLDGRLPVTLCDIPDGWGASWALEDAILVGVGSGLWRVSAAGGSPSVITTLDATQGELSHRWPEILPGGKAALFTILTTTGSPRIGLLSLETDEYRVLVEGGSFARYVPTGHLVYVSERSLLAVPFDVERLELAGESVSILEEAWTNSAGTAHFTLSRDGTLAYVPQFVDERTLVWVDRKGVPRPITETRRNYSEPRLSPDGQRLAVTIDGHIWVYELGRNTLSRLSFGPVEDAIPIWSPDGSRLAFQSGPPFSLFWQSADGSDVAERLTTSERLQVPTSWSPDGKMIVYYERKTAYNPDIWFLALQGERTARPFLQTPFSEAGGALSPDGRFLAYRSNESGRLEIYVRPFPGPGGKWQISNDGGEQPVWARSGREIFYRNGGKMMVVPIQTEPAFRAGKPTVLFDGRFALTGTFVNEYDVAPDGEHFVMLQDVESRANQIHVVLNWFEELKARVPHPL
jgi:serine/threonine-protein kinase